jgi:hypothetical protein
MNGVRPGTASARWRRGIYSASSRLMVRTVGWVLLVACCLSVGCGGGRPLKADGGAAGAAAGAAGVGSGGGGEAGSAGGAGANVGDDGGKAGASADGRLEARPPLACPEQAPADGTACAEEGLNCGWGDDVRGDNCRPHASCASHHWNVKTPDSNSCPPLHSIGVCPANTFAACTDNTTCTKADGTFCRCTSSPPTSPVGVDPPQWYCHRQDPGICPVSEPNFGTACAPDGTQCPYFWVDCQSPVRICAGGAWVPGQVIGCPVPL